MAEFTEQEQKYFETAGNVEITEAPVEIPAEAPQPAESAPPPTQEQIAQQADKTEPAPPTAPAAANNEPPKMVDIKALHEARAKNRDALLRLQQMEQRNQDMERRLREFEQRLNPGQPKPSFEENPAQHLQAEVQETRQDVQKLRQEQQQAAQMQNFQRWYHGQAQAFAAQQPDFSDAYSHYQRGRAEQLANSGLTDEQIVQRVQAEEMQLAATAVQVGQNPAAMIYQLATLRGYKPVSRETQNTVATGTPALQPGQNPSTVAQQPSKLETVKRGMEVSKPLSSVGGGGQIENLTWDAVAAASDDEFLAMWAKMEKAEQVRH